MGRIPKCFKEHSSLEKNQGSENQPTPIVSLEV
jgi:hypothetical protein